MSITPAMSPTIAGLFIYPVKSCKGIAVSSVPLTPRGFLHDREWMIVSATRESSTAPYRFVTQREYPRLALIRTALSATALELSASGCDPVTIDFATDGEHCDAVVWSDTVSAIDQGSVAAGWLSAFVGADLRLVRFDPSFRRLCNPAFAGDSGANTGFADGYPLLVIGTASLADLNGKLLARGTAALPMNRFRPNIVLDGIDAYDEDHLSRINIGDAQLRMVKPCTRCRITTTDQDTADVGDEPLATLAGYRNNPRLGGVTFGMNAIVSAGYGRAIDRGAAVDIGWNF